MKPRIILIGLICYLLLAGISDAKKNGNNSCTTIQDGVLKDSAGNLLTTGYDKWGYNYQAHMFNGLYWNYSRPEPPWTKETLEEAGKSTTWLVMKWNDAWLSNKDCDGDGKLDRHLGHDSYRGSGAWETNHQFGTYEDENGKIQKWNYFVKIVSAPTDAYTATNEDGVLMYYGADHIEIGSVIWTHHARILQVYNDTGTGEHGVEYLLSLIHISEPTRPY